MTSQIGYLKLLITRSILSGPPDFEIKRVACIWGCAADLGIDFITFGIALGYIVDLGSLVIAFGHKISRFGIDLGQRQKPVSGSLLLYRSPEIKF